MRHPILVLPTTSGKWSVKSDAFRGDSWFGSTDGIHTVAVHFKQFIGRLHIQGTLAHDPQEEDWFDIVLNGGPVCCTGSYLQFDEAISGAYAFTFMGNFLYLRAVMDRDYISSIESIQRERLLEHGDIDKVILSL